MSLLTKSLPPLLTIVLSGALSLLAYPYLDSQIPVHWGATGNVSTYADRDVAVFLNPAGACIVFLFFLVIPYVDRRRVGQLKRIGLYVPLRNIAIFGFSYAHLLGVGIGTGLLPNHANLLGGLTGLLFVLFGWELRLPDCGALAPARRLSDRLRGQIAAWLLGSGAAAFGFATIGVSPLIWSIVLIVAAGWSAQRTWQERQS